ncbi:MAG: hypothetical protein ACREMP_09405 [Candidatus Tyrphobacter sp.]
MRASLALLLLPAIAACARVAPPAVTTNPAAFPFYPQSRLLAVRRWEHALSPQERSALGITGAVAGAYRGHEVVTATGASFDELIAWLSGLAARPPDGYRVALWGSGVDTTRARSRADGIDFSVFQRDERGATHDVAVMVVDPALFQRKAGLMLSALNRFRDLPGFLRAPIDAQAQAQTGFTVSQALDPATPIGAAIDALGRLDASGSRGVVFVDARPVR